MITLKHDTLSFNFPEIAREVRSLIEERIQQIAAELPTEWDRTELLSEVESNRYFHKLSPTQHSLKFPRNCGRSRATTRRDKTCLLTS
jgi:hypothetical protein